MYETVSVYINTVKSVLEVVHRAGAFSESRGRKNDNKCENDKSDTTFFNYQMSWNINN